MKTTGTAEPTQLPPKLTTRPRAPGKRQWLQRLARYAATPAALGVILLLVYWYVSRQELDALAAPALQLDVLLQNTKEHIVLTVVVTAVVVAVAVPLGILLTRPFARPLTPPLLALANIGQGVPSIGLLVLLALVIGTGFWPAAIAFIVYAILPVLRNTMVGLEQVDRSILEAGRGMGISRVGVLVRIELPLAVPVMLAGIRTALVISVGTATLATFVGAGGLGDTIDAGLSVSRQVVVITGAVLTAVLALAVDWLAGVIEDVLRPRGL